MAEDLINGVNPTFYESIITQRSWWKMKDTKRIFFLTTIHYLFEDGQPPKPVDIVMFEVGKETPTELGWRYYLDLYLAGTMIKFTEP